MTLIKTIPAYILLLLLTIGLTGCGIDNTQDNEDDIATDVIHNEEQENTEDIIPKSEERDNSNDKDKNEDYIIADYLTGFWRAGPVDAYLKLPRDANFQYHGVNIRQYQDMYFMAGYAKRRKHPLNTYTNSNIVERHKGEVLAGLYHYFINEGMGAAPRDMTITTQENVSISGIGMIRLTGYFSSSSGQSYFIAYSTVYNGSPIYVIGMAGANSQSQGIINKTVYDIMHTLRTER